MKDLQNDFERSSCLRRQGMDFIDNSVKNLDAAEKLGIKPILFNRDNVTYAGTIVNIFAELGAVLLC